MFEKQAAARDAMLADAIMALLGREGLHKEAGGGRDLLTKAMGRLITAVPSRRMLGVGTPGIKDLRSAEGVASGAKTSLRKLLDKFSFNDGQLPVRRAPGGLTTAPSRSMPAELEASSLSDRLARAINVTPRPVRKAAPVGNPLLDIPKTPARLEAPPVLSKGSVPASSRGASAPGASAPVGINPWLAALGTAGFFPFGMAAGREITRPLFPDAQR